MILLQGCYCFLAEEKDWSWFEKYNNNRGGRTHLGGWGQSSFGLPGEFGGMISIALTRPSLFLQFFMIQFFSIWLVLDYLLHCVFWWLAYNFQGSDSKELAAASKLEDDVSFYQTTSPDVAKLFHIDPQAKRPSLVLLKQEAEKLNKFSQFFLTFNLKYLIFLCDHYIHHQISINSGGQFTKTAIAEFVFENKLPLLTNLTRESAPTVFENPIKKQVACLFFLMFDHIQEGHWLIRCLIRWLFPKYSWYFLRIPKTWRNIIPYFEKQQSFSRERWGNCLLICFE